MASQGRKHKMAGNTKGLKEYAKNKSKIALEKVDKAIRELSLGEQKINFNSVSNLSGVSKTFLYNNAEIKQRIEELRDKQTEKVIRQRLKYDKTDKSKDIIIMSKDKKIKELQEENRKLKEQLEVIRGKLYSMN
jgi:predicted phage-related endonuclease